MKQATLLLNLALALGLFTASANGATITWASGASGNWSNPTNWNPNQVPGQSDTAVITASGNYTVTVDSNVTVNALVLGSSDATAQTILLNGRSLAIGQSATVNTNGVINIGSGTLDFDPYGGSIVNGTLDYSGGTLGGVLTIASNGVANLVGAGGQPLALNLNYLSLTNYGTVIWSNIDLDCSSVQVFNYGLWDAQSDNTFYGNNFGSPNSSTFDNNGTVRKDGGVSITTFDNSTIFNNRGTVDVETAQINIDSGIGGGLFNTASKAIVWLGIPNGFALSGDVTFTGPGLVGGDLYGGGVSDNYNGGVIHGSLNFYYGTLGGYLMVASNAVANLVGPAGLQNQPLNLNYLSLTNCGTVIWSNMDLECSSVRIFNYGLWDAQSDNTFYGNNFGGPNPSTFNNNGTVRKDGGASITTFDNSTVFNNSGTVDVETAQINIDSGTGGGLFNTAGKAIVWLGIPNGFALSGDVTFTGPGFVGGDLYGGGVSDNYNGGVVHGSLNFYYGTLGGYITVASNAVANLVSLNIGPIQPQPLNLNYLSLTNCGTVIWNNIDLDGSSARIFNYGLWDAQSDNTFYGNNFGSPNPSTFNNNGTVRKDGGTTITHFDNATVFNNNGTVDVETAEINIDSGTGGGLFNTASNSIVWLGIPNGFALTGDVTFTGPGFVGGDLYGGGISDNYNGGVIHGSLNFYYGTLGGYITVASNAVASLVGLNPGLIQPQPLNLNYLSLTNCGTVIWSYIDLDCSSAQIHNYGLWDAQSDNTFYGNNFGSPNPSTFNNNGTVRKDGGASITTFDNWTIFTNSGTVDVETAQINIDNGIGGGLFNTASNSIVWLGIPNGFSLTGDVTFTGPGFVGGDLYGGGISDNYNGGVIHGSLNFYYGTLGGYITVASNAVASLMGLGGLTQPLELNYLSLTNCGTINWSNIDLDGSSAQIYNHGLWDAQSDNTFYGNNFGGPNPSTFNNCGTVRKDGGSGITTFDNSTTYKNVGRTDVQRGQVTLAGSCSLTNGTLNFGISGPTQFGAIDFASNVQLAGRVSVNFTNHYTPAVSNSFPVVVYSSETGTFSSLCLPALSAGLFWQTNYTSSAFTLSISAAAPVFLAAGLSAFGNSMVLSWNGVLGQTYQVQCTTNLATADWVNLGDPIAGTNGPITVLDSLSASPQKYYRIQSQ